MGKRRLFNGGDSVRWEGGFKEGSPDAKYIQYVRGIYRDGPFEIESAELSTDGKTWRYTLTSNGWTLKKVQPGQNRETTPTDRPAWFPEKCLRKIS